MTSSGPTDVRDADGTVRPDRWITSRVRAATAMKRPWDAIVVGSGIGGLVCAALLAKRARMRVLVLERHYTIGGLSQSFRRRGYRWEVGVHYVGDMGRASSLRRIFDAVSGGRVTWSALPTAHDRLIAPGIDARLGGNRAALRQQWLALAPGEDRAADRILDAITECARAAPAHFLGRMRRGAAPSDASPFLAWSDRTSADVIAEAGASPRLANVVTYNWSNYGLPPEVSSFAALAITTAHYMNGAFAPVGGGSALARALAETIVSAGGSVIVRAEVAHVSVRDGRATGVVLADGAEVTAPIVVSAIGARSTFDRLVPDDTESRDRMPDCGLSTAHVGLYLGVARAPSALGLDGTNLFIQCDAPGDRVRDTSLWCDAGRDEPPEIYVSTNCAVDPSFATRYPGRTVITATAGATTSNFERWAATRTARRGIDYEAVKARIADSMMRVIGRHIPLADVECVEVSTPLSTRDFAGHASGEIYGLAATPGRFRNGPGPHTSTRGLYLTGQDVWMGGVGGAAAGGALTACAITNRDLLSEMVLG